MVLFLGTDENILNNHSILTISNMIYIEVFEVLAHLRKDI